MPIRVWIILRSLFFGATAAAIPRASPGAPLPQLYLGLGHSEPVTAIAWSPDGKTLATGSSDDTVVLWDVASRRPRATLTGYTRSATVGLWQSAIAWSPDGRTVAAWDGHTAILWDAATGRPRFRLTGFVAPLEELFWSQDSRTLIGFDFHRINVWDPQIRQGLPELRENVVVWDAEAGRRSTRPRITVGYGSGGTALSPDGRTLAGYSGEYLGSPLALWDTRTWRRRATLDAYPAGAYVALGWSPDSHTLASLGEGGVALWDASSSRRRALLPPGDNEMYFTSLAWGPDGKVLATVCSRTDIYGSRVVLWDPVTGRRRTQLDGDVETELLSWSPSGKTLVGYGQYGTVLWDVVSGSRGVTLPDASWPVAWSPAGKVLATGGQGNSVVLWDGLTGRRIGTLASHTAAVAALAWSPDGTMIAIGSGGSVSHAPAPDVARSQTVVWNPQTGKVHSALLGLPGAVYALAWSPDSASLAVAAGRWGWLLTPGAAIDPPPSGWQRAAVALWKPGPKSARIHLPGAAFPVAWNPHEKTLVTGAREGNALLWDETTGQRQTTLPVDGHTSALSWSPDGRNLAIPGYSGGKPVCLLWDPITQKIRAALPMPGASTGSLAWSPDGATLAIAADDWFVTLWDPAAGSPRRSLTLRVGSPPRRYDWPRDVAASLAWSPDGKILATGLPREGVLKLWRAAGGELAAILTSPAAGASPLTWSPDGKTLAGAYQDHTVILWDPVARKRRTVLRGHTGAITAMGWSPDGRVLATASEDGSLRLWSAATGRELIAFYSLDGGKEWLATTPEVYFQASPHGADLIQWRQGAKLWPLARFRRRFERPDLLRRILAKRE